MSSAFWIGVIIFAIVFFGWLIWEAVTAPVMPDDYDMTNEEKKIWKELNGSKKKKEQKDDKWYPDNKI